MPKKQIPAEAVVDLRRRLDQIPPRSPERRLLVQEIAQLYGVSEDTVYRTLRENMQVRSTRRADCNVPRVIPKDGLERYCEIIAAIKIRTSNRKGRHLSTVQAIRLLESDGINTDDGHVTITAGLLKPTTVNRYLKKWGYDRDTLIRQPPAVRFQAEYSNQCWHFDLSPSDLKHVKAPAWIDPGRGHPLLMLYSVVDDRSGVAYQEYHGVYGEDVEAALRFMFAAMSPKREDDLPFQGIPKMVYMDNGPIAKSSVFQKVMGYLGIDVRTHLPNGKDGRRVTARSKGKVERPFRTVKEMHETLYHLHEPETEAEANAWLMKFLLYYNSKSHRSEPHSRIEDWVDNLPQDGIRQMCNWERFCTFARSPERRKVGIDARVMVEGVAYEVEPDLAGEIVVLWWGLFDNELYVEHGERRYGPFLPVDGPIPLHRYRSFKKTRTQKRADRIEELAKQLSLPSSVIGMEDISSIHNSTRELKVQPFVDPNPFQELTFSTVIAAKLAIAEYLARPLAKLTSEQMAYIDAVCTNTLDKQEVMKQVRDFFKPLPGNGGTLSVVLVGHPKLKNDLRRPSLEEIGARTNIFSLEGIRGHCVSYIKWLLSECIHEGYQPCDLITDEAITFLAERLTTPLQIEHYLQRAFEDAYKAATKPVTIEMVEAVLAVGLNDLEPRLIRHGYSAKVLAELLNVRTSEINSFLHAQLPPGRTEDLRDQMLKIGIPLYASERN